MPFKSDEQRKGFYGSQGQDRGKSDTVYKNMGSPSEKKPKKYSNANVPSFVGNDTLSEREVKLLQRRLNDKKISHQDAFPDDKTYKLTPEQNKKGIDYLKDQLETPRGVERKNNPFGAREEDIIRNFDRFELVGYYDTGNQYVTFNVPLYRAYSKKGDYMEYYISGGKINIIG